jgi:hypothetical protein
MNVDETYRLRRAKELLANGDEDSLIYCCLELRLCIELICYRRLRFYAEHLPSSATRLWRAKEVLATLLELDPTAGTDYSLAMGLERSDGSTGQAFHVGTYKAITKEFLSEYYDEFSSFLHAPTIAEVQAGTRRDVNRVRALAEKAITVLEDIAGHSFQSSFGPVIEFPCESCGTRLRRRTERLKIDDKVRCLERTCRAEYEITFPAEGQFLRKMVQIDLKCPSCSEVSYFGRHVATRPRVRLRCLHCSATFTVETRLVLEPVTGIAGGAGSDRVPDVRKQETCE